MKIVFFGSANFAVPSLEALLATHHELCCVVTQPDRQKGRGLHLEGTAVKEIAVRNNLKIFQPERINSPESIKCLNELKPELFVVLAYGQILSEKLLSVPKILAINAHASLLPKYRGAAPINWALIKGEKKTGLTVIKMVKEMDAGPIILEKPVNIGSEETFTGLEEKLSETAAILILEALDKIENKTYLLRQQDESKATFAPKLKKDLGRIDWERSAAEIVNLVRGSLPWPGAYTYYKKKFLKIHKAQVSSEPARLKDFSCGQVLAVLKARIDIASGDGIVSVKELQIEGKRKMNPAEFISGHKISVGEKLG